MALPQALHKFIDLKKWKKILELNTFDSFDTLADDIERQPELWKKWIEGQGPDQDEAPSPYSEGECSQFAAILLRKALKPQHTLRSMMKYIERALGPEFVHPVPLSLREVFDTRSKCKSPILLLLTPGNDPMEAISQLAEERLHKFPL